MRICCRSSFLEVAWLSRMAWQLSSSSTDSESSDPCQPDPVVAAARVGREVALGPRDLAAAAGTPACLVCRAQELHRHLA